METTVPRRIICRRCEIVMFTNPTVAQQNYALDMCSGCEKDLMVTSERIKRQRERANEIIVCKGCGRRYRCIDVPNPGDCSGCKREKERMAKLAARLKNPPMCTKCGDEEDADEDNYPGLCARCIDRQLDEEMEEEEAQDEIRIQREAEEDAKLERKSRADKELQPTEEQAREEMKEARRILSKKP